MNRFQTSAVRVKTAVDFGICQLWQPHRLTGAADTIGCMDFTQRCSDADRDEAIKALSEHHAAGRIDFTEFDERSTAALSAKTFEDLRSLFGDLPAPQPTWPESLRPAAAPSQVPAVREESRAPAETDTPKWVSVAQAVVWPVMLVLWLGVGWGAWWIVFIAAAINAGLHAAYGRKRHRREIEGG